MTTSSMIAALSPEGQALLGISILWLCGFLMSRVSKVFSLPNVTGYILAGVVIGPYCLNLLPQTLTSHMSFITDAALAMIAFGVGRYMQLDTLRSSGSKMILLTVMESLVAALLVTLSMLFIFHLPLSTALLLGAIGSATAPASSLMTIRQYKAKGPFVNTLIQVVALDDAVALLAFSVCAAIAAGTEQTAQNWMTMLMPILTNLAVLLVCYVLGRLLVVALRGRSPDHRIVLTCAFIFLIAGGCATVNVSPLLGCMMLGATYVNVSGDKTIFKQVNRISPPINILFFVLSGMRLNLQALTTVGIIGVAYFAIRIIGKYIGAWMGCRMIHALPEVQRYLGLALIPQAGVSIGLAVLAQRILPPDSGMLINTIILSSSVLYEMIGPMSAKYALFHSGAIKTTDTTLPVQVGSSSLTKRASGALTTSGSETKKATLRKQDKASSALPVPEKAAVKSKKKEKERKKDEKKRKEKKAVKKQTTPERPVRTVALLPGSVSSEPRRKRFLLHPEHHMVTPT